MEAKNNKPIQIVVVGAGPAGLLFSYLVSKLGNIEVTILEKNNRVVRKNCGEYLCPPGVSLLKKLSLNHLLKDFHEISGMKLWAPNNHKVDTFFTNGFGCSLNREKFEKSLLDQLLNLKNVKILFGHQVIGIEKKDKGIVIYDQSERTFFADYLIASDGRNSTVSKLLGHREQVSLKRVALHAYINESSDDCQNGEMIIFNDGSYCGLNPVTKTELNVSLIIDNKKLKNSSPLELMRSYFRKSSRLNKIKVSNDLMVKVISPIKHLNRYFAKDNVSYLGDAGGFVDPLTGEGIYNALLSASILYGLCKKEQTLKKAFVKYQKIMTRITTKRKIILQGFQILIKFPLVCNFIAWCLIKSQKSANYFIGIIAGRYKEIL